MAERSRLGADPSRILDLVVSMAVLVLGAPVIVVVAVLVRVNLGSPVLFRQQRAGVDGKPFELVKFRTMRDPKPGEEGPEFDAVRLTKLGQILRSTSLDELPTMVNVLWGDMAIVGPRPLPVRYLPRYSPYHARRHEVRGGITGLAQTNGRNTITWDEQLDMDIEYVENRSLALDLRILARTVKTVLRREGISEEGHATRSEFPGSGYDLASSGDA